MSTPSTLHILIVDDDALDRRVTTRMLRSFPGAVSHEAASLEAAFEVLGTQEIHCILVDHNIPPSTSEELLEAAHAASWGDTPVIVITGLLDDELRARLLLAGAQDFLTKDAAPLEVRRSIENAIWRQQSRLAVSRGAARMRRSRVPVRRPRV